jgi:hypothetical protein
MSSKNIYTIYRFTNNKNNKVYIGKTSNFRERINSHKFNYKNGDTVFYKALRKHGWGSFCIDIIYQTKNHEHCLEMETYFIYEYNSYISFENSNGYNMTLGGEGSLGANTKTYNFYDIYGNYYTITNLYQFCTEKNISSKVMYDLANGKRLKYDIYISALKEKRKFKTFKLYDTIKQEIIEITDLSEFCEKNGYNKVNMMRLVTNGVNHYDIFKNINKIDYIPMEERKYSFIFKGQIITIINLKDYCEQNNLSYTKMNDLYRGKCKSHGDYINNYPDYIPPNKRILKLISPSGEILEINNIKKFCIENGLSDLCIQALKSKKQKQHKGYRLYE